MGRLYWRERWSAPGCRRGWVRLLPFVAFVLIGYFGLYAWLRVSGEIAVEGLKAKDGKVLIIRAGTVEQCLNLHSLFLVYSSPDSPVSIVHDGKWPRESTIMMVMWPAVKLEAALDRRGWLPWTNIRTIYFWSTGEE